MGRRALDAKATAGDTGVRKLETARATYTFHMRQSVNGNRETEEILTSIAHTLFESCNPLRVSRIFIGQQRTGYSSLEAGAPLHVAQVARLEPSIASHIHPVVTPSQLTGSRFCHISVSRYTGLTTTPYHFLPPTLR